MPLDPLIARGVESPDISNSLMRIGAMQQRDKALADDAAYQNALIADRQQGRADEERKAAEAQEMAMVYQRIKAGDKSALKYAIDKAGQNPEFAAFAQQNPEGAMQALIGSMEMQLGIKDEPERLPTSVEEYQRAQEDPGYAAFLRDGKRATPTQRVVVSGGGEGGPSPPPSTPIVTLSPSEIAAAGLKPGTVAQRDNRSGKVTIIQKPSKLDIGDGKFKQHAESMLMQKQTVLDNIKAAKDLVRPWTTGLPGQVTKKIGGTGALDLASVLESIKADIGFSRLQEMREASPTGGALGQVAVQELTALQASIASLEQAQSEKAFNRALGLVETRYKALADKLEKSLGTSSGGPGTVSGGRINMGPGANGQDIWTPIKQDDDIEALLQKYGGE